MQYFPSSPLQIVEMLQQLSWINKSQKFKTVFKEQYHYSIGGNLYSIQQL